MSITPNYALIEQQRQQAEDYVAQQIEYEWYLLQDETNPCIYEKQLGQAMSPEVFEAKLKKLNPNLQSEIHPHKSDKRCLYYINGTKKDFITAFENTNIPENSIWACKEEEVWDRDFVRKKNVGGVLVDHIEKADMPRGEYDPVKGWQYEGGVKPGFKKVKVPWHEAFRGWRKVLAYIVRAGYATPAQVENIFGSANTPGWKKAMGKGNPTELW